MSNESSRHANDTCQVDVLPVQEFTVRAVKPEPGAELGRRGRPKRVAFGTTKEGLALIAALGERIHEKARKYGANDLTEAAAEEIQQAVIVLYEHLVVLEQQLTNVLEVESPVSIGASNSAPTSAMRSESVEPASS
jgi:hypothetical protein